MPSKKDLTGQRFGRLTARRLLEARQNGRTVWECECDCKNIVYVLSKHLVSGRTKSCGCLRFGHSGNDLTGRRFGRLTALRQLETRQNGRTVWECECDCKNIVYVLSKHLVSGRTKSCGCLKFKNQINDLTGRRFSHLVARWPTDKRHNKRIVWVCECDCGNFIEVSAVFLLQEKVKSCGCVNSKKWSETGKKVVESKNPFGLFEGTEISQIKSQKPRKNCKTGQKGVRFKEENGKYHATISLKGRRYHLGYFETFAEAREARLEAEKLLFEPMIKKYEEKLEKETKAA